MSVTIKLVNSEKWLGYNGSSCHVIGIRDELKNQNYGSSLNVIVRDGKKSSVNISGESEILPEHKEKSVRIQEVRVVPNITKKIVSVGLLLQDGDDM